jgi:hypothetical protein
MSSPRKLGPFAYEDDFFEAFQLMKSMVEELYHERGQRRNPKVEEGESSVRAEGGVGGGGPSEPSSPSSSSSTSEASVHSSKDKKPKKTHHSSDMPLLKLDVKFNLPTYDGELDAKKLDNWIRQLEVYCRIQRIVEDETKIQLASLKMGGTTLIWWERKTKDDLKKSGKTISSWNDFVIALKQQFYPLAYMQQEMMNWKSLRQAKGQSVQEYTQTFRKKALNLGIPLYTQETLLKYIGGLHSYLKHTILMLNPSNFDEVCVQAIHIESSKGNVGDSVSTDTWQRKDSGKRKEKEKKTTTTRKEKPTCKHCKKVGHDEDHCWILHPELKPKKYANQGRKNTTAATVQVDLGSDSGDETKVVAMGIRGINYVASTSSSNSDVVNDECKRSELFHIRVITNNVKVDTLVDSGSQANLISEEVVNNLGLETKPHPRPYPLGWICGDNNLQVTKQCKIKFAITSNYVDEVELDIVPLDICGIVLGSPYLYDRKSIFYREENKYCFKKDGKEYIVRAHRMKTDRSFATTGQLKRMVNASKSLTLMSVTKQEVSDAKHEMVQYVSNNHEVSQEVQHEVQLHTLFTVPVQKGKHVLSFSFAYSVLLFSLLLFSGVWLLNATKNVDDCAINEMITLINNAISVFMFVVISQVIIVPAERMDDTGQVGRQYPHFLPE